MVGAAEGDIHFRTSPGYKTSSIASLSEALLILLLANAIALQYVVHSVSGELLPEGKG